MNQTKPAFLYDLSWSVLDWLFPPFCAGCGTKGENLCAVCQSKLIEIPIAHCKICGKPLHGSRHCLTCQGQNFSFKQANSACIYQGIIRRAIHQLKFKGNLGLANLFSKMLFSVYLIDNWQVDLLTAVPLSVKKMNERGFNQSALIGKPLSARIGVPFKSKAIIKVKDTDPQVGLNQIQRQQNLKEVFRADPKLIKGKSVLLVDDVMTTGATFQECSEALLSGGAREVYCLSVATTEHFLEYQD